jgi:hypothetical protein
MDDWSRHTVRWEPARATESAELTIRTRAAAPITFDIDGVVLMDPRSSDAPGRIPLPPREEEGLFGAQVIAYAEPAAARRGKGNNTARWALIGAAMGIVVAAAAAGAAGAARRRRTGY